MLQHQQPDRDQCEHEHHRMNLFATANNQIKPTCEMKPQRIPWVIEKVRGMRIIVKNAGSPSSIFPKSIWLMLLNIDAPTSTSTGAVA
jgi:hypothetical protein